MALGDLFGLQGGMASVIIPAFGAAVILLVLFAVAVTEALHLYPILYLNLAAALANLDPALDEAARNLGAGKGNASSGSPCR